MPGTPLRIAFSMTVEPFSASTLVARSVGSNVGDFAMLLRKAGNDCAAKGWEEEHGFRLPTNRVKARDAPGLRQSRPDRAVSRSSAE